MPKEPNEVARYDEAVLVDGMYGSPENAQISCDTRRVLKRDGKYIVESSIYGGETVEEEKEFDNPSDAVIYLLDEIEWKRGKQNRHITDTYLNFWDFVDENPPKRQEFIAKELKEKALKMKEDACKELGEEMRIKPDISEMHCFNLFNGLNFLLAETEFDPVVRSWAYHSLKPMVDNCLNEFGVSPIAKDIGILFAEERFKVWAKGTPLTEILRGLK